MVVCSGIPAEKLAVKLSSPNISRETFGKTIEGTGIQFYPSIVCCNHLSAHLRREKKRIFNMPQCSDRIEAYKLTHGPDILSKYGAEKRNSLSTLLQHAFD